MDCKKQVANGRYRLWPSGNILGRFLKPLIQSSKGERNRGATPLALTKTIGNNCAETWMTASKPWEHYAHGTL